MFKKQVKSFWKMLLLQFSEILKPLNFIFIIAIPLFCLIAFFFQIKNTYSNMEIWIGISAVGTWVLLWKFISDKLTKENIDINRAMFLTNGKHTILLTKIISNVLIFITPFLLYILIILSCIGIVNHSHIILKGTPDIVGRTILYILSITILYVFANVSTLYINTLKINKIIKTIIRIIFPILIITLYYILPIAFSLTHILDKKFNTFLYATNGNVPKLWAFSIPIVNITYLSQTFQAVSWKLNGGLIHMEPLISLVKMIPFIIETSILIGVIYWLMNKNVKESMCT